MQNLQDNSIDMVLADLPYGCTHNTFDNKLPLQSLWAQLERVCKPTANILLFANYKYDHELRASNEKNFRYEIIWVKNKSTGFYNVNHRPLVQHEKVLIFSKKKGTWNPQMSKGHPPMHYARRKPASPGTYGAVKKAYVSQPRTDRFPTTIIAFPVVNNGVKARLHPSQKPVPLLEYLIRSYSNENEMVLDVTMGSGSTGEACILTQRSFIGIELQTYFCDAANKRLSTALIVNKSSSALHIVP